jgi:geranylgeranyl diphosphate synthase, type I
MSQLLNTLSQQMIPAVEQEMREVLQAQEGPADTFHGMMHYPMGWVDEQFRPAAHGGKRIRPLLCLLACHAAGGDWRQAVPPAAAIELLHNFTLVHDDIQDASPLRHNRPTVWQIWGANQAINTGDAMFALAHIAMSRLLERGVPAETVVCALRRLDETCIELTKGQHADMDFENRPSVTVDDYVAMINGKTAALLALCTELGAMVAGRDSSAVAHFAAFGREMGLAFQVRDDILGIWGEESAIGKSAATDIETRKKSLPVLYGLERSEALRTIYGQADNGNGFVGRVVRLLDEAGARGYAEQEEKRYADSAQAHLEAAEPAEEGYLALRQLGQKLLGREA